MVMPLITRIAPKTKRSGGIAPKKIQAKKRPKMGAVREKGITLPALTRETAFDLKNW